MAKATTGLLDHLGRPDLRKPEGMPAWLVTMRAIAGTHADIAFAEI